MAYSVGRKTVVGPVLSGLGKDDKGKAREVPLSRSAGPATWVSGEEVTPTMKKAQKAVCTAHAV